MPSSRNSSSRREQEHTQTFLIQNPRNSFCEDFLKNNYWDMSQTLEKTHECSICLDEIDCKKCFTLLTCGHIFHLPCIVKVQPMQCPLCRNSPHHPSPMTHHRND